VAGVAHYTRRGSKGDEVPYRGLQHHLANKGGVNLVQPPQLEDRNIHNLKIRPGPRKGGRDQGILAQARPDSISHLLEFGWRGDVIGEEGQTSICVMNRLHPERGFLSKRMIYGSHKSGKYVCQRKNLQQNKDLPTGRASSGGVQPAFAAWHGGESSLMHSNDVIRIKIRQRPGESYQGHRVVGSVHIRPLLGLWDGRRRSPGRPGGLGGRLA
jgi:hypothetical protein